MERMKVYFKQKKHDFPKKLEGMSLSWYNQGRICIAKRKACPELQKQNINLIKINRVSKSIWTILSPGLKKDMAKYSQKYREKYPVLRKRGISSYSAFLMIIHALVKRFYLQGETETALQRKLMALTEKLTVYACVCLHLLKKVDGAYRLNKSIKEMEICRIISQNETILNKKSFLYIAEKAYPLIC